MSRARWPGWTAQHTLLLPVPPEAWPPPEAPVTLDGVTLQPKRELHITLVGTRLGKALREAERTGRFPGNAVRQAFARQDWQWTRTGETTLLRAPSKRPGGPPRRALIEHVDLPAMAHFHHALGELLGETLAVPPPHVTLYVAGTDQGIGLPDRETLAKFRCDRDGTR